MARLDLATAYEEAATWAEHGYTPASRSYWTGVRDTLAVVLGITTEPPVSSSDDAAATIMLRRP